MGSVRSDMTLADEHRSMFTGVDGGSAVVVVEVVVVVVVFQVVVVMVFQVVVVVVVEEVVEILEVDDVPLSEDGGIAKNFSVMHLHAAPVL